MIDYIKRFFTAKPGENKVDTVLHYTRETLSWLLILVAAFVIAILINMYVIRFTNVTGNSMNPTYQSGEKLKMSKMPYVFGDPEYGDIVVFDSTKKVMSFGENFVETCRFNMITQQFMSAEKLAVLQDKYYIKRVIAVEGDKLEFKEGKVYRNGELLQEDYILTQEVWTYPEGKVVTVEKGHVFVMGDNRNNSTDSRTIGSIPVDCILGKVM